MSAEERLRRRVAELEQALEACAATGASSAGSGSAPKTTSSPFAACGNSW